MNDFLAAELRALLVNLLANQDGERTGQQIQADADIFTDAIAGLFRAPQVRDALKAKEEDAIDDMIADLHKAADEFDSENLRHIAAGVRSIKERLLQTEQARQAFMRALMANHDPLLRSRPADAKPELDVRKTDNQLFEAAADAASKTYRMSALAKLIRGLTVAQQEHLLSLDDPNWSKGEFDSLGEKNAGQPIISHQEKIFATHEYRLLEARYVQHLLWHDQVKRHAEKFGILPGPLDVMIIGILNLLPTEGNEDKIVQDLQEQAYGRFDEGAIDSLEYEAAQHITALRFKLSCIGKLLTNS